MYDRYPVITLCGSTKYMDEFRLVERTLNLSGGIVISPGTFSQSECIPSDILTLEVMKRIVDMHWQKIDMADAICIVHPSYQGESTKNEIKYAKNHNKFIMQFDLEKHPVEGELSHFGYMKLSQVFLDTLKLLRRE